MIDVHVPQKSEHTWTDFFIHIGTIAVGLLLAIGLEQGVEWLHHRHQRNDLIVAMRAEAQNNRPVFERAISARIAFFASCRSLVAALAQATPHNGMVDVTLPAQQPIPVMPNPARATWTIAKTNDKAALLPDNLAELYNRLDYEADLEQQSNAALAAPALTLQATTIRLGIDLSQATRVHLSVADRDALAQALAQVSAAWSAELGRMAYWRGANNAVAGGVQSWAAMGPYIVQSTDALHQAEAQAVGPAARSGSAAPENSSTTPVSGEHTPRKLPGRYPASMADAPKPPV